MSDGPGWRIDVWDEALGWCWRAYDKDEANLRRRLKKIREKNPGNRYRMRKCRSQKSSHKPK